MNWISKSWVSLTFIVIVLTLIAVFGRNYSGQAYAKTSWEYKVVSDPPMGEPERSLNQLGIDGWELVHYIRNEQKPELQGTWIFKRPK
jgi:hypothetical protein